MQGRAGFGIKVAKITDERGDLVAGMIVGSDDEVMVVMERGKVVRSAVSGVPAKGRDTMGVVFAKPDAGDRIIAVAINPEGALAEAVDEVASGEAAVPVAGDDGTNVLEDAAVEGDVSTETVTDEVISDTEQGDGDNH